MPKRDPRVTAYIQARAPFARPILRHLRQVIHAGGPGLGEAMSNFGRITSLDELPGDAALRADVKKAMALVLRPRAHAAAPRARCVAGRRARAP